MMNSEIGMMNIKLLILLLILLMSISCKEDESNADGDSEILIEVENDIELDPELVWQDPKYKLIWQKTADNKLRYIQESIEYCNSLILAEFDDWRLPTIDELRTIIIGCPYSEIGVNVCKTSNQNQNGECFLCSGCANSDHCQYCGPVEGDGPGIGGCFWPAEFSGNCDNYISSTICMNSITSNEGYMSISFENGAIGSAKTDKYSNYIRCVRGTLDRSQIIEHVPMVDCKPGQGCE